MPKMKPVKAWAVIDESGRLECYDHRLPIAWLRDPARNERDVMCGPESRLVRVEIREVPRKGAKHA